MPIRRPWASNSGPPELPGLIEASVWMQSVYSSSVPVGDLVAMHAGDDPVGDGGLEVGGQQEGVAHGEDPIAHAEPVAVAQLGGGEIVAAEELDQGHVAGGIEADQHGVVDLAVGHAALHRLAAGQSDVEIGQGVAVGRDDHARAAPLPAGHERRPARSPWPSRSRRSAGPRPPATAGGRLGRGGNAATARRSAKHRDTHRIAAQPSTARVFARRAHSGGHVRDLI